MNRPPRKKSKTTANKKGLALSLEKQVELAMSSIGSELTQEYFRALEVTPKLVRKETRIADFLRAENHDPEHAAKRLARYWKTRKLLFGERWLLPMTMTGAGCLDANQIEILRSGFICAVNCARKGVLLITDFASLPKGAIHAQVKILFYFLTIYPCHTTGIHVVRHGERPAMTVNGFVKQVLDSVATTSDSIDVVRAYEEGREHLLDYLGYQQRRFSEINMQGKTIGYVAADSVAGTLRIMKEKGFDPASLPVALGGEVDRNYFDNWVRARLSVEDIMSGAPIMRNHSLVAAAIESPSSGALLIVKPKTQRDKETLSLVMRPDETPEEFAKRKNAVYVRRNYRECLHWEKLFLKGTIKNSHPFDQLCRSPKA